MGTGWVPSGTVGSSLAFPNGTAHARTDLMVNRIENDTGPATMLCMTRRGFGLAMSAAYLSIGASWKIQSASGQIVSDTYLESNLADRSPESWVEQWQTESLTNKDLQGPLDLRRFKDPMYILLGPIGWKPNQTPSDLSAVVVPVGFVTDFASIPRVFWSLFRPDGNYAYAAVLHDYLYWSQDRPKSAADAIFRAAMDDLKITDRQSAILYHAVDSFGYSAWTNNTALKAAGEKRVLSQMPNTSEVTWEEWKTRPGVFAD